MGISSAVQATAVTRQSGVPAENQESLILDGVTKPNGRFPSIANITNVAGPGNLAIGQDNEVHSTTGSSTAVGNQNYVDGKDSDAFGDGNIAKGNQAMAFGDNNDVIANQSSSFGINNKIGIPRAGNNKEPHKTFTPVEHSNALGSGNHVTSNHSAAIGQENKVSADYGLALGDSSVVSGKNATAIGHSAQAVKENANAMGQNSVAAGKNSLAIGGNANSKGLNSISLGYNAKAVGDESEENTNTSAITKAAIAIGSHSEAHIKGVALGNKAYGAKDSVAIGDGANTMAAEINSAGQSVSAGQAVAIGGGSPLAYEKSTAVGYASAANGLAATALGHSARASGMNSIAIGKDALVDWCTNLAGTKDCGAIAIGNKAQVDHNSIRATIIGQNAKAIGAQGGLASGYDTQVYSTYGVALGSGSRSGTYNDKTVTFTTAVGGLSNASGNSSTAIGARAQSKAESSLALGYRANASHKNAVALGSDSETSDAVGTTNAKLNGLEYGNFAGTNPTATVSVGKAGAERTITNVAAGRITDTSTDAVNGSQLYATNSSLGNLAQTIKSGLGGKTEIDNKGNITINDLGDTGKNTVHDAIKHAAQGWNVQTNNDAKENIAPGDTLQLSNGKNISVTRNGKNVIFATKDDVDFTSVKTGNTTMNNNGVKVGNNVNLTQDGLKAGDISVTTNGINGGNKQIKNIAEGTEDTDAVNVSQLNKKVAAAATKVTAGKNISVTSTKNADGSTSYNVATKDNVDFTSVKTGNTTMDNNGVKIGNNVALTQDGLRTGNISVTQNGIHAGNKKITGVAAGDISATSTDAVNGSQLYAVQKAATAGWNLTANGKNKSNVGPDATVDLNNKDGNILITKNGNNVTFGLNNDLTIGGKNGKDGSIGIKGADGTTGVTINGKDGSIGLTGAKGADGKNAQATLKVETGPKGLDGNDGKNGDSKTRLVYTKQDGSKEHVATMNDGLIFKGDKGEHKAKLGSVVGINGDGKNITTEVVNNSVRVKMNDNIKVKGVTVEEKLTVNNGATVNMGNNIIHGVNDGVADTDAVNVRQLKKVDARITENHNAINRMGDRINKVDKDLRAGIAGATAIAFLQRPNEAGKSLVSLGVGSYRSESAVAIGYARNSDNNKISIKIGAGLNTRSDMNFGGSIGYQW